MFALIPRLDYNLPMSQALYRKWRPHLWADVVGQDIIAYPNPIQFGEFGGVKRTVKFMNVPLGAVVEIYTVTGDKIRQIEAEVSQVVWDGERDNGELVTSGLYIYRVQMPGNEAFGRIAVLR